MGRNAEDRQALKTKRQLIEELQVLRARIAELESSGNGGASTQEAASQRLLKTREAFDEIPDGVMLVNTAGEVLYINRAFERLLGYEASELVGSSVFDLPTYASPEDKDRARDAFKEVLRTGLAEHVDIGAMSKSGDEVAVSFAASVVEEGQVGPKALIAVMRDITKRKRAEDALKEREENFRALIENSLDISVMLNEDLTIRYVSKSIEQVLGYIPQEIIGENALGFLSPEDVDNINRNFDLMVNHPGQPVSIEVRFRHNDGSWRVIEGVANNLVPDPTVLGIVVNARDITERKLAENTLREREEHFRALIENSLEGIAILDSDFSIRYESPSAERILGYRLEELLGRDTREFLHPDDASKLVNTLRALAKRPARAVPGTVRFLHKDGTWHFIEGIANNLLNDPTVRGIVINYRDVTERVRAEEALKQREEHFRVMIENSLDDVAILDRDGTILYQSPSIERVLGYKAGEHKGYKAFDFIHPDDMEFVIESFANLVGSPGSTFQGEVRSQHRDGSWRTLEVMARNFLNDPIAGGILANFRDITGRKVEELERVEHAAALARADELQRSRQRLVTVEESVRREIAQQLHGTVQNRLIILLHRLSDLQKAASPGELSEEIGSLRLKVEDLLESHVRSISHRLYPSILRRGLVPALQSLGDQFETTLTIDMELDEKIVRREKGNPQFILEQVRLAAYRIAEEALTNATKHAKASRISIGLELASDGWIRLAVRNDGLGFDMEKFAGGLGILMMQDYAEMVGGKCAIWSSPEEGTEVTAVLPLAGPGAEHSVRTSPLG